MGMGSGAGARPERGIRTRKTLYAVAATALLLTATIPHDRATVLAHRIVDQPQARAVSLTTSVATQTTRPTARPSRPDQESAKPALIRPFGKLPLQFEENRGQTADQVNFLARARGYTLFLTPTGVVVSLSGQKTKSVESKNEAAREGRKAGSRKRKAKDLVMLDSGESALGVGDAAGEAAKGHAALPGGSTNRNLNDDRSPDLPMLSGSSARAPPTVIRMRFEGANPTPVVDGLEKLPGLVNYFLGNDPAKWQRAWRTSRWRSLRRRASSTRRRTKSSMRSGVITRRTIGG